MAEERTELGTTTAIAETAPVGDVAHRRWHPALIVLVAIGLALLLGWIFAGLPGIGTGVTLSVVLLVVAGISAVLTLAFVANAIRKARRRERLSAGELLTVALSSLIIGIVSIIQVVQTVAQIARH